MTEELREELIARYLTLHKESVALEQAKKEAIEAAIEADYRLQLLGLKLTAAEIEETRRRRDADE